jgi:hypothetical protein
VLSRHAIVGAWHRASVFFSATKIASDWLRLSVIATGAETRPAGSDRSLVGRAPAGAGGGAADRRQPTGVWRWQQRFAEQGVDGLLRDNQGAYGPCHAARIAWFGPAVNPAYASVHWQSRASTANRADGPGRSGTKLSIGGRVIEPQTQRRHQRTARSQSA